MTPALLLNSEPHRTNFLVRNLSLSQTVFFVEPPQKLQLRIEWSNMAPTAEYKLPALPYKYDVGLGLVLRKGP